MKKRKKRGVKTTLFYIETTFFYILGEDKTTFFYIEGEKPLALVK